MRAAAAEGGGRSERPPGVAALHQRGEKFVFFGRDSNRKGTSSVLITREVFYSLQVVEVVVA